MSGDAYIDGLVQDCNISSALAMEILQCCTEPWILRPGDVYFEDRAVYIDDLVQDCSIYSVFAVLHQVIAIEARRCI